MFLQKKQGCQAKGVYIALIPLCSNISATQNGDHENLEINLLLELTVICNVRLA